jgi:AcrR family transcriptional regulator
MADIAEGAGVTRTALYHYFPGKDEVLQALIKALHESTHRSAIEALEGSSDLGGALLGLLQAKFGKALTLMNESPNGVELAEATHKLTGSLTRAADADFLALVIDALRRHGRAADAEATADTLIAAAKGLMRSGGTHVAKTRFDERLGRLVGWLSV